MIKFLRVEFDSSFDGKKVDDSSHKLDSIFFFIDVIGQISLRIIFLCKPIEDISNEFKVGFTKILKRDNAVIVERSKHFT